MRFLLNVKYGTKTIGRHLSLLSTSRSYKIYESALNRPLLPSIEFVFNTDIKYFINAIEVKKQGKRYICFNLAHQKFCEKLINILFVLG